VESTVKDTLTLALDGDVSLGEFSVAMTNLSELLRALAVATGAGTELSWTVEQLDRGSTLTTVRGSADGQGPRAVERVIDAYEQVGSALESGRAVPFNGLVQRHTDPLLQLLGGRVEALRFETPDADFIISGGPAAKPSVTSTVQAWSYGAVQGRVQTLSSRGALRFTLYDLLADKAVSCYLNEGQESMMRDAWGRLAFVEGRIRRHPVSGRPVTVRRVTAVTLLPEFEAEEWQALPGRITAKAGSPLPEETVRRMRDA
jgi:hypothetical protein